MKVVYHKNIGDKTEIIFSQIWVITKNKIYEPIDKDR